MYYCRATGGSYLIHSTKGRNWSWKNHLYNSKIFKNGKWIYIYGKKRIIGLLGGDLKKKVEKSNKELEDAKREYLKYNKASYDFFNKKNQIKAKEYMHQSTITKHKAIDARANLRRMKNKYALYDFLYKISPLGIYDGLKEIHTSIKAEREELKRIKENKNTDPSTGLRLKTKKTSAEEDLAHVNPGYKNFSPDTKQNCMMCTTTFELRRRGYDVTAKKENVGATFDDLTRWFPDAEVQAISSSKIEKSLIKQGDGARGNLMIPLTTGGGHSIAYEIKNSKIILYDGQSNKVIKDELEVFEYLHELSTGVLYYARLDNCRIDPEQIKKDACR